MPGMGSSLTCGSARAGAGGPGSGMAIWTRDAGRPQTPVYGGRPVRGGSRRVSVGAGRRPSDHAAGPLREESQAGRGSARARSRRGSPPGREHDGGSLGPDRPLDRMGWNPRCRARHRTNERGWILGYGSGQFYFGLTAEQPARITYLRSPDKLTTGTWYQVAATYDGVTMKLYVDGALVATHEGQRGPILQPDSLFYMMGAYRDDNDYYPFTGKLERITVGINP